MMPILQFSFSLLENFLILTFPTVFLNEKHKWVRWVCALIMSSMLFYFDTFRYPFLMIFSVFFLALYSFLNFTSDKKNGFFYAMFLFIVFSIIDMFTLLIEDTCIEEMCQYLYQDRLIYNICLFLNNFFQIIVYYLFCRHKHAFDDFTLEDIQIWGEIMIETGIFLLIFIFLLLFSQLHVPFIFVIGIMFSISFNFILFIYQFSMLIKSDRQMLKKELHRVVFYYSKAHYEEFQKSYDKNRALSHDMKQHITVSLGLLKNSQYKRAIDYLEEIYQKIESEGILQTNRDILNHIINTKIHDHKKENIKYIFDIKDTLNFISDVDLCILIGNLMDNCFEAVNTLDHKFIKLITDHVDDIIFIELENTYDKCHIKAVGTTLLTHKEDQKSHGYGMKNIEDIVHKYRGDSRWNANDTFQIFIYFTAM